jgi:hypothetical protein
MSLSRLSPGRRELMLFGLAYLLYSLGRWVAVGDTGIATRHAHWIVDLERSASLDVEGTVLLTWLVALPIYALYPVAPPRLADIGLVDTITTQIAAGVVATAAGFGLGELARRKPLVLRRDPLPVSA